MVRIVCIFHERRNESSLPAARLARVSEGMRPKSIAMTTMSYPTISSSTWFRRRRAHAGGPLFWRTVPQIVAVTKIGVAMRSGAWWRLLDCTWSRAISQ
jgi:hypothetical protein